MTASSSGYSPSLKTGSSVRITPATSSYSPSIWSAGIGTPMSVPEAISGANPQAKPPGDTSPELSEEAKYKAKLQKLADTEDYTWAVPNNDSSARHHIENNDTADPYTITFHDANGVPVQNRYPLKRGEDGIYRDATGQPCALPKGAWVATSGKSSPKTADHGSGTQPSEKVAKASNVDSKTMTTTETPSTIQKPAMSVLSNITVPYSKTHPHMAAEESVIFEQEANGGNFKLQLNEQNARFAVVFTGAIDMIKAANPSHFKMSPGVSTQRRFRGLIYTDFI